MGQQRWCAGIARLEALEERRLLSTYLVDNGGDMLDGDYSEGRLTLREAVELANTNEGEDTIRFASSVSLITLTDDLTITDDTRIEFLDETGAPNRFQVEGYLTRTLVIDDGDDDNLLDVTIDGLQSYSTYGFRMPVSIKSRENLTILNTRMSGRKDGHTTYTGGIIQTGTAAGAFLIVRDSLFSVCRTYSSGYGPAFRVAGMASVEFTRSAITGDEYGAIGVEDTESVRIINCTVSDNRSSYGVAGVRLDLPGGSALVSNCTIASNASLDAERASTGGLAIDAGVLRINSSILAYNLLEGAGAEMAVAPGAEIDLAGSRDNLVLDGDTAGWLADGVYGNILGVDPLLETLADNGGLSQTRALRTESPAIGNGNNDLDLQTDQRGMPYTRQSGAPDIGAYEAQTLGTVLIVDSDLDTEDGDYSEGRFTLRRASPPSDHPLP